MAIRSCSIILALLRAGTRWSWFSLSPTSAEPQFAHTAVLMAEGRVEEAIQPARRAVELSGENARGYRELARAHLAAGCAMACPPQRKPEEKKAGKKRGRHLRGVGQSRAMIAAQRGRGACGASWRRVACCRRPSEVRAAAAAACRPKNTNSRASQRLCDLPSRRLDPSDAQLLHDARRSKPRAC